MINEPLLHNWFYGNYGVRVAAALSFAYLFASIPIGSIVAWLSAGLNWRVGRIAGMTVPALNALKGFLPVAIALHGGGQFIGLFAAMAATLGHYYCPWRQFRGDPGSGAMTGILFALSPPAALVFAAFWSVSALASRSVATGTVFASFLMFFPLWYLAGAPAALFGIAAGAAVVLRVCSGGEVLERRQVQNFNRATAARRN